MPDGTISLLYINKRRRGPKEGKFLKMNFGVATNLSFSVLPRLRRRWEVQLPGSFFWGCRPTLAPNFLAGKNLNSAFEEPKRTWRWTRRGKKGKVQRAAVVEEVTGPKQPGPSSREKSCVEREVDRGSSACLGCVHVRRHGDRGENKRDLAMEGVRPVPRPQDRNGSTLEHFIKKSGTRKVSVAFENKISKTDAEKCSQDSEGGKNEKKVMRIEEKRWKAEWPTGAFWSARSVEREEKRRPRSLEEIRGAPPSEVEGGGGFWRRRGCGSRSRSSSGCGSWAAEEERSCFRSPCRPHSRCRSSCEFFNGRFRSWEKASEGNKDFRKLQRSLKLLGLDLSDFGIRSDGPEAATKKKSTRRSSTLSTRITGRSVSLDSLKAAIRRRAWPDDHLDVSHRRLLAQAAYEEWYFMKERQLREKREEDRIQRLKTKLKLQDDFQRKKEKSEEEFKKWYNRKATKRKDREGNLLQSQEKPLTGTVEAKEKSEKAFLDWKKHKEGEIKRERVQKRKKEEEKNESEKQKAERKIIAEKAFQQWKTKLEEKESRKKTKRQSKKRRQEIEERRKRAEGSQISYQMWKEAKDEQIKEKIKLCRAAERAAKEERFARMEERMYEAEQAFEDWLERVDLRKEKQFYSVNTYQKIIPWIPA